MTLTVSVGPQYGPQRQRSHGPPVARPYDEYRSCLRLETAYTCVYCLSTEPEVGPKEAFGGFEIEHFRPQSAYKAGKNLYSNLLWSCKACNRAKRETWPTAAEVQNGSEFLDPYVHSLADHLRISGYEVVAVDGSPAGQYIIDEINLNSPLHIMRRKTREAAVVKLASMRALVDHLASSVAPADQPKLLAIRKELGELELGLRDIPPWDAPDSCACKAPARPKRKPSRRERKNHGLARRDR